MTSIYPGLAGIVLSCYAINVERQAHKQRAALCDLNEHISCTRVLTSPYAHFIGHTFGLRKNHWLNIPNTYLGLCWYLLVLTNVYLQAVPNDLLLIGATATILFSCYLAYILAVKLKDVCVVCIACYAVNIWIFVELYVTSK